MEWTPGQKLKAVKSLFDGDMKTVLAFPDKYPTYPPGTEVEFVKKWSNLYGWWINVKVPNGRTYDVRENTLTNT